MAEKTDKAFGPGATPADGGMSIVPDEDLAPLFEEIDRMAQEGGAPPAAGPGTEPDPGEIPPVEGDMGAPVDVQPIADALSVPIEKAQRIYDAAQGYPKLSGKSPEEVGTTLSSDFRLLMQIEEELAGADDAMAMDDESLDMDDDEEPGGGMPDMGM